MLPLATNIEDDFVSPIKKTSQDSNSGLPHAADLLTISTSWNICIKTLFVELDCENDRKDFDLHYQVSVIYSNSQVN